MVFPYLLHVSLPQGNTRVFLLALTSATQEWRSERQSSSEIYRMLQAAGFEAKCLVEKYFFWFLDACGKQTLVWQKWKNAVHSLKHPFTNYGLLLLIMSTLEKMSFSRQPKCSFSHFEWENTDRAKRYYIKVRRTMSFRAARQPIAWFYCQWICGIDRVGRFLSRIHGVPNPDTA